MATAIGSDTSRISVLSGGHLVRLAVPCLGVWLHAASTMLAATTLPSAVREFGGGHLIGWAFTLYLVGSILAGAATGVLARRFPIKVGMLGAATLYIVGCVVCAGAPEMVVLLLGRLLQGIGGGFLVALTYVGINRWYDAKLLPRLMAIVSAVWSTSAFCGPLVGGTFSTFGEWRWAFWAFVVQAGLFLVACWVLMPKERTERATEGTGFPFLRLAVLCGAILSVATAGVRIDALVSPLLCLMGAALLGLFLRLDAGRREAAMFPSRPLSPVTAVGAGLTLVLAASIATMSFLVYGPILLETIHGISPLVAGYIVAFESISWGIAAVAVSGRSETTDNLRIRLGSVLIGASILGFALSMSGGPLWVVLLCAAGQGAGFGISWAFIVRRITVSAAAEEQEVASAAIPTMQQIGFAAGAAATGIVANAAGFGNDVTVSDAISAAPWIFAAFLPFALVAILAAWRTTAEQTGGGAG